MKKLWDTIISEYMTEGSQEYLDECLGQVNVAIENAIIDARQDEVNNHYSNESVFYRKKSDERIAQLEKKRKYCQK